VALSAREVYLLLRAKDEASRVVRGFSSNLLRTAAQVQAQALRAEAMNRRAEAQRLRSVGATKQQIDTQLAHAKALENEAREVERNAGVWRRYVMQMEAVGSAMIGVGTGFAIAGGLGVKFFFDSVKSFEAYQKDVALTKTQVRDFHVTLAELGDIGIRTARNIAVPFEQIQPALFDIFSSIDVGMEDAQILIDAFSRAAVAGNTSIRNAARGTISILNAFNIPASKVNRVLDIQFELVRRGVGTYEEFATHLGNVIPSAARAGQSVETMAAALVFLTRNGLSAAMAATSAARAFEAMSHPKAVAALKKLGVNVRDANGNFIPLNESLALLRDKLMKLPPADRVAELVDIFKGAGGTIQARRFLEQVLLRPGELEEFTGYLKDIEKSSGAFQDAYGEMADTVANKSQLLANRWQVVKLAIGEALVPFLSKLVGKLSELLEWFNRLDPNTKNLIITIAALASVGAVLFGGLLILVGGFILVVGAIAAAGAEILIFFGVVTGVIAVVGGLSAAFVYLWKNSEPFRGIVKDINHRLSDTRDTFMGFANSLKKSWDEKIAPPLHELWTTIDTKVLPAFREFADKVWTEYWPKIQEAFNKIQEFAHWAFGVIGDAIKKDLIPAIEQLVDWWHRNEDTLKPFLALAAQVAKWGLIIAAVIGGTVILGAIMAFITAIRLGATWLGVLGGAFAGLKIVVSAAIGWIKMLIDKVGDVITGFKNWSKKTGESLGEVKDKIFGFFSNAGQWLLDAGGKIVQGLIDGIKDKKDALIKSLTGLAGIIYDHLPHSPAKKGPLAGAGSPYYSGQAVATMFAAGIAMRTPVVTSASRAMAGATQSQFGYQNNATQFGYPGSRGVGAVNEQDTASKNVNTYVTVNTQEINPAKNAAELGFLITSRMGS
jgi:TP901 family phage tail tape measure protein